MEAIAGRVMEIEDENVVIEEERPGPGFHFNPSYPVYNFESENKEENAPPKYNSTFL